MLVESPAPLDRHIATLIADLRATQAEHRALAILHALITGCLIRILTRLENLVTLWQAGQLPPPSLPAIRAPRAPADARSASRPRRACAPNPATRRAPAESQHEPARPWATPWATPWAPPWAPPPGIRPPHPSHPPHRTPAAPARAPPRRTTPAPGPEIFQRLTAASPNHAQIIPLSQ